MRENQVGFGSVTRLAAVGQRDAQAISRPHAGTSVERGNDVLHRIAV